MSYYNTTKLSGATLFDSIEKCKSQDDTVLRFFKENPNGVFSACDIYKKIFESRGSLLTSVRRSITNLTISGDLIKTDQSKTGIYGKKVFMWKLNLQNQ